MSIDLNLGLAILLSVCVSFGYSPAWAVGIYCAFLLLLSGLGMLGLTVANKTLDLKLKELKELNPKLKELNPNGSEK